MTYEKLSQRIEQANKWKNEHIDEELGIFVTSTLQNYGPRVIDNNSVEVDTTKIFEELKRNEGLRKKKSRETENVKEHSVAG